MSVSTTQRLVNYQGNGSDTTPYPTLFPFLETDWVKVVVTDAQGNETTLVQGIDYTVTGAGSPSGGEVVTTAAYDSTNTITIYREVPLTQLIDFLYNDRFPSELVESGLDKITMALQQLAGNAATGDRSIRFPFSEPPNNETVLPPPVARRDAIIYFDQTTGEMAVIPLDQLAQRLLVILGAEAVLPYRTKEISNNYTISQFDVNSSIRVNTASDVTITLPATDAFSGEFFCAFSRFNVGAVEFTAPVGVIIDSEVGSAPRIFGAKKPVGVQIIGVNRWWVYGDIY